MRWFQINRVAVFSSDCDQLALASQARVKSLSSAKPPTCCPDEDRQVVSVSTRSFQEASSATRVVLPRSWLVASWFVIITLHAACGVYLVLNGCLHLYLTTPQLVYLSGFTADMNLWHFKRAALVYICVGVLHLARVAYILIVSLRNRAFPFRYKQRRIVIRHRFSPEPTVLGTVARLVSQTLERQGLLYSQGGFTKVFIVQEIIVVFSQTYQANRCCNLLSRSWISSLYVALVIANCWIIPSLCFCLRDHRQAVLRAVLLSVDALLNMGSCFVLPFLIFWPYYCAFDTSTGNFPLSVQYDSIWQSRLITEMQMVFALSLPDLLSKMLNNLTVFASLMSVSRLLLPQQTPGRLPIRSSLVKASFQSPRTTSLSNAKAVTTNRWIALLQILLVAWGLSLLGIYCAALNRTKTPLAGCIGLAHPWFSMKYSCSIIEINCYRRQVESPTREDLVVLNPESLLFLCISHCPGVRVPTEIQAFPNLLGVQLHNCTILEWSTASAISATIHTRLTAVVVTRCNMSSFPQGLLQPMPTMLSSIVFSHTNLRTLPTGLRQVWKPILHLIFDYSDLQEVPESIFQLDVVSFSFVGNRIQHLPSLDNIHKAIQIIDLGINPLQDLPATIGSGASMGLLNLELSNISSIPPWFATNLKFAAANGSPYCALPAQQRAASIFCMPMNPNSIGRLNMTLLDEKIPL